jgi:hypothetical protein
MALEVWKEITAEYKGRLIKGSFKFVGTTLLPQIGQPNISAVAGN